MLTLRQIEIIRAIMITGTVNGAAQLLNVSAPGVSRAMKHAETTVGLRLFTRQHGRYAPTHAARDIFRQMQDVFRKIEDLQLAIGMVRRGTSGSFSFAAVPSISQYILAGAVQRLRQKYPDLRMIIDVIKIEEATDFLLLKKGEIVVLSYKLDHPALHFKPLAPCSLLAIVPEGHELAKAASVTVQMLIEHPMIGFDPQEPYGRNIAQPFLDAGVAFELSIQARYAHSVLGLVQRKLGVAVIDAFSVAGGVPEGVVKIPLEPPSRFMTYVASNIDAPPSNYAESLVEFLRIEAKAATGKKG